MKRITRFRKRTWVLLGVVAVIAAMASVGAYAFWTSSGSGSGSATTANPTADYLSVINLTTINDLYPGGQPRISPGKSRTARRMTSVYRTSFRTRL